MRVEAASVQTILRGNLAMDVVLRQASPDGSILCSFSATRQMCSMSIVQVLQSYVQQLEIKRKELAAFQTKYKIRVKVSQQWASVWTKRSISWKPGWISVAIKVI